MVSLYAILLFLVSIASARIAMTRAIHVSKLAITFFRIIILFIILCILITIIFDQLEINTQSLNIFNNIDQPNPIELIPSKNINIDSSLRTVLNIEQNNDEQEQNNDQQESIIIYNPKPYIINNLIELESSRLFTLQNPHLSLYYDYIRWPCSNHIQYKPLLLLPQQNIQTRPSVYNIKYLNTDNDNGNTR
eukprot:301658_1